MQYWKEELYNTFLKEFPEYYYDPSPEYFPSGNLPGKLTKDEAKKLNNEINLPKLVGCEKEMVLHKLLNDNAKDNFTFYVLSKLEIDCEVNTYDKTKKTAFIKIAKKYFDSDKFFGHYYISTLFRRGYKIKEEDRKFVLDLYKQKKNESDFEKWTILRCATILDDLDKFEILIGKTRELFTILSFKIGRPISFNFPNLLGVAVNAIIYYRENGDIILRSIDKFNQADKLLKLDQRKNTFKRKRLEYLENKPIQNKDFEIIALEVFPELK